MANRPRPGRKWPAQRAARAIQRSVVDGERSSLGDVRLRAAEAAPGLARRPQVVAGGEQPEVDLVVQRAPEAAPEEDRDHDRDQAEDNQVPGVIRLQRLLEDDEDGR